MQGPIADSSTLVRGVELPHCDCSLWMRSDSNEKLREKPGRPSNGTERGLQPGCAP